MHGKTFDGRALWRVVPVGGRLFHLDQSAAEQHMNKQTDAWARRNGKVVSYRVGEERPNLPEPEVIGWGRQLPKFTGQKHVVKPGSANWGEQAQPKRRGKNRRRKAKQRAKKLGAIYSSETGE